MKVSPVHRLKAVRASGGIRWGSWFGLGLVDKPAYVRGDIDVWLPRLSSRTD
ncbi:hypothetical protein [Arthrobacter tumbae]|uniref:hypothetical protein n=1 Tax=Arthrobacter tumbae TaxID=163874 RepID=UPI00195AE800|nr:hypothetical protein [Arthrobacter tumbae]MBM7782039.1 hypothetical protein [Arthrobacter tumbae]